MFTRQENKHLPKHISYYLYKRDKSIKDMSLEDQLALDEFYKSHNINYKGLTPYQHTVVFKRTLNFIKFLWHRNPLPLGGGRSAILLSILEFQFFLQYRIC